MSPAWIAVGMLGAGVFALAFAAPRAKAAERTLPGAYEIVWYRAGKDYRADAPNFGRISGEPYDSRTACDIAIKTVKVRESGIRLRCDPVDPWRTR